MKKVASLQFLIGDTLKVHGSVKLIVVECTTEVCVSVNISSVLENTVVTHVSFYLVHLSFHRLTKYNDYNDTRMRRECDYHETDLSFTLADYECSFRGYPLQGKKVTVPAGYKGMIFMEKKKTDTEGKSRNLHCTGSFSQFVYWNYDKIPSKNDALSAAVDWIDIADAVSSFSANMCSVSPLRLS